MEFRTITVEMLKEEFLEFQQIHFLMFRRKYLRTMVVIGIIYIIIGMLSLRFLSYTPLGWIIIVFGMYAALFKWIGIYQTRRNAASLFDSPANNIRIKYAHTIDETGIKSSGQDGSYSFIPWSPRIRVLENESIFVVMISFGIGQIYSHRHFADEATFIAFRDYVREQVDRTKR